MESTQAHHAASSSCEHTELAWRSALLENHLFTGIIPGRELGGPRIERIARTVVAAGSWLAGEELLLLGELAATVEAATSLLATTTVPSDELDLRVQRYAASAAGTRLAEVARDPVARSLCSIGQRLWRAPLARPLWPEWMGRVFDFLEDLAAERHDGGVPADRDLDTYLARRRNGSGLGVMTVAAWMLIGEPELARQLDQLEGPEHRFALAARIAADLRDPRSPAAATIRAAVGESALRDRLAEELRIGHRDLERAPAQTERSAAWLASYATLTCVA